MCGSASRFTLFRHPPTLKGSSFPRVMSIILLSASPWMLDSIRERDPGAAILPVHESHAILATHDAVICKATSDALFSRPPQPKNAAAPRAEYALPGGFRLRVVRDSAVMGSLQFLAVAGDCWCPWGVWALIQTLQT